MKVLLVMAAALLATGCAETASHDARFGAAWHEAALAMTIDPNAGARPDEIKGIDGRSGKEVMKRYQDSFKEPPPVTNVINIGGAIGAK